MASQGAAGDRLAKGKGSEIQEVAMVGSSGREEGRHSLGSPDQRRPERTRASVTQVGLMSCEQRALGWREDSAKVPGLGDQLGTGDS